METVADKTHYYNLRMKHTDTHTLEPLALQMDIPLAHVTLSKFSKLTDAFMHSCQIIIWRTRVKMSFPLNIKT